MSAFTSATGPQAVPLRRVCMVVFWTLLAVALAKSVSEFMPTMLDLIWDKAQHFVAFATLTSLAILAWPAVSSLRVFERMALLGAMIEVIQATPALQRGCDIFDWAADMVAVSLVLGIRWIARRCHAG